MVGATTHTTITSFGKKLSVVYFDGNKYLIGVQIAALLKRETFNMYRSMKIKNIRIKRADPKQVDYLCECNAVRPGTHSVTLIPFESGLYFIAGAFILYCRRLFDSWPLISFFFNRCLEQTTQILHFKSKEDKLYY